MWKQGMIGDWEAPPKGSNQNWSIAVHHDPFFGRALFSDAHLHAIPHATANDFLPLACDSFPESVFDLNCVVTFDLGLFSIFQSPVRLFLSSGGVNRP